MAKRFRPPPPNYQYLNIHPPCIKSIIKSYLVGCGDILDIILGESLDAYNSMASTKVVSLLVITMEYAWRYGSYTYIDVVISHIYNKKLSSEVMIYLWYNSKKYKILNDITIYIINNSSIELYKI